jgi:hypothetical protein
MRARPAPAWLPARRRSRRSAPGSGGRLGHRRPPKHRRRHPSLQGAARCSRRPADDEVTGFSWGKANAYWPRGWRRRFVQGPPPAGIVAFTNAIDSPHGGRALDHGQRSAAEIRSARGLRCAMLMRMDRRGAPGAHRRENCAIGRHTPCRPGAATADSTPERPELASVWRACSPCGSTCTTARRSDHAGPDS